MYQIRSILAPCCQKQGAPKVCLTVKQTFSPSPETNLSCTIIKVVENFFSGAFSAGSYLGCYKYFPCSFRILSCECNLNFYLFTVFFIACMNRNVSKHEVELYALLFMVLSCAAGSYIHEIQTTYWLYTMKNV